MAEEEEEEIITEEMSTAFLPPEIHTEILSWIPAKSLINSFKFVCKAWRNLIKDPNFVKTHLNRRSINGGGGGGGSRFNNESLIRKCRFGNAIFQLHPPFNYDEGLLNPIAGAKEMDIDFRLLSLKSRLLGSCNGLLCLRVNHDEIIILLNPSTRKYRVSPKQLLDSRAVNSVTYGFGCYYNSTTAIDEYKVVRFGSYHNSTSTIDDHSCRYQIDIYSMSSNSWRRWTKVKDVPYEISPHRSGVFLNGAFHWMGCKHQPGYIWDTIVCFNTRDEEFGHVPVPPPCSIVVASDAEYPYIKADIALMNVRGYLGNVYFSCSEMMDIELEIWVMKDYGMKESWTKEYVIRSSDSDPPTELFGFSTLLRSMTCFFTGDHILIEGRLLCARQVPELDNVVWRPLQWTKKGYGRLVLYDRNKKKIHGDFRMADIPCVPQDDQVDYIETLVSLESSVFPLSNNRKRKYMESLRNQKY